jgi:hypothetical protein
VLTIRHRNVSVSHGQGSCRRFVALWAAVIAPGWRLLCVEGVSSGR